MIEGGETITLSFSDDMGNHFGPFTFYVAAEGGLRFRTQNNNHPLRTNKLGYKRTFADTGEAVEAIREFGAERRKAIAEAVKGRE